VRSAWSRTDSSAAIVLNARATRAISSAPRSGARAVKSPAPSRSAADSSACKRRREGEKISAATTMAAATSSSAPGNDTIRAVACSPVSSGGGGKTTMPRSSLPLVRAGHAKR